MKSSGIEPYLATLLVEQLNVAVAWKDIIRVVRRKRLVAAGMNEADCVFFNAARTTVILRACKAGNIMTTNLEEPSLSLLIRRAW